MNSISSRSISEHLSTLATLLEAESLRCKALGAPNAREVSRRAAEVRNMAEHLWEADTALPLAGKNGREGGQAGQAGRAATREAANSLEALGLGANIAALVIQQSAAGSRALP